MARAKAILPAVAVVLMMPISWLEWFLSEAGVDMLYGRRKGTQAAAPDSNAPVDTRNATLRQVYVRVVIGAAAGLVGAGVPLAVAVVPVVVHDLLRRPDAGAKVWPVLFAYPAAGILGGAIIGIVAPVTRWAIGAVCVGALLGFIAYSIVILSVDGFDGYDAVFPLLVGGPIGGLCGFLLWYDARGRQKGARV